MKRQTDRCRKFRNAHKGTSTDSHCLKLGCGLAFDACVQLKAVNTTLFANHTVQAGGADMRESIKAGLVQSCVCISVRCGGMAA
jgi:hypothetical protein